MLLLLTSCAGSTVSVNTRLKGLNLPDDIPTEYIKCFEHLTKIPYDKSMSSNEVVALLVKVRVNEAKLKGCGDNVRAWYRSVAAQYNKEDK